MITKDDVSYVAKLARLSFEPEELDRFSVQLTTIIDHIDKIAELELDEVPPTSHVIGAFNIFREDEVRLSVTQEEALSNGPSVENGAFRVPPILKG
jgi:aspartyl-tRNA(Asn)/glutamyl-tRNA(Gln) amidotransferase subunit C